MREILPMGDSEHGNFPHRLKVAILGSGNIGTDLMLKLQRSPYLQCSALIGRSLDSKSRPIAEKAGVIFSPEGIEFVKTNPQLCDLVFDATSARAHEAHAPILRDLGIKTIDLTPAKIGSLCVPAVNGANLIDEDNLNMVTCGGQASAPIAYALGQSHSEIEYIEVVSSIASKSAGPATRANLDEYIHTTESGVQQFSGALKVKAILNLNPAEPCIDMQTTVFAKVRSPNLEKFKEALLPMLERIHAYVPGYQLIVGPLLEGGRIVTMVRVKGLGDYLPQYAGNLDIINCAAIAMAEQYALRRGLHEKTSIDQ